MLSSGEDPRKMVRLIILSHSCGRCRGLEVTALDSGLSGPVFEPWLGSVCCVLGKDELLLQYLSPPRGVNGYQQIICKGKPCDGLASHPVRSRTTCINYYFILWKQEIITGRICHYD